MTAAPTPSRHFKGIWIPREIWLDRTLPALGRLLLAEIDSLSSPGRPCWASNEYFADLLTVSERRVQQLLDLLVSQGRIERVMVEDKAVFGGRRRTLKPLPRPAADLPGGEADCGGGGEESFTTPLKRISPPHGENSGEKSYERKAAAAASARTHESCTDPCLEGNAAAVASAAQQGWQGGDVPPPSPQILANPGGSGRFPRELPEDAVETHERVWKGMADQLRALTLRVQEQSLGEPIAEGQAPDVRTQTPVGEQSEPLPINPSLLPAPREVIFPRARAALAALGMEEAAIETCVTVARGRGRPEAYLLAWAAKAERTATHPECMAIKMITANVAIAFVAEAQTPDARRQTPVGVDEGGEPEEEAEALRRRRLAGRLRTLQFYGAEDGLRMLGAHLSDLERDELLRLYQAHPEPTRRAPEPGEVYVDPRTLKAQMGGVGRSMAPTALAISDPEAAAHELTALEAVAARFPAEAKREGFQKQLAQARARVGVAAPEDEV